ncbi:MAG: hypothetical protein GF329_07850 [Candidatus Lokiarchaeota archaeon]|nr:hypothetical protein [Candidatus Lokiarchaeota archaeon]
MNEAPWHSERRYSGFYKGNSCLWQFPTLPTSSIAKPVRCLRETLFRNMSRVTKAGRIFLRIT